MMQYEIILKFRGLFTKGFSEMQVDQLSTFSNPKGSKKYKHDI
jgi:hypothetical protein